MTSEKWVTYTWKHPSDFQHLTHNLMTRVSKHVTRYIKILQHLRVFSGCLSRLPLCNHFSPQFAVCCCLCYWNMKSTHGIRWLSTSNILLVLRHSDKKTKASQNCWEQFRWLKGQNTSSLPTHLHNRHKSTPNYCEYIEPLVQPRTEFYISWKIKTFSIFRKEFKTKMYNVWMLKRPVFNQKDKVLDILLLCLIIVKHVMYTSYFDKQHQTWEKLTTI